MRLPFHWGLFEIGFLFNNSISDQVHADRRDYQIFSLHCCYIRDKTSTGFDPWIPGSNSSVVKIMTSKMIFIPVTSNRLQAWSYTEINRDFDIFKFIIQFFGGIASHVIRISWDYFVIMASSEYRNENFVLSLCKNKSKCSKQTLLFKFISEGLRCLIMSRRLKLEIKHTFSRIEELKKFYGHLTLTLIGKLPGRELDRCMGNSSKRVTVTLVRTLCWWFYDDDRFKMLVTESLCWRLFGYVGDFLMY